MKRVTRGAEDISQGPTIRVRHGSKRIQGRRQEQHRVTTSPLKAGDDPSDPRWRAFGRLQDRQDALIGHRIMINGIEHHTLDVPRKRLNTQARRPQRSSGDLWIPDRQHALGQGDRVGFRGQHSHNQLDTEAPHPLNRMNEQGLPREHHKGLRAKAKTPPLPRTEHKPGSLCACGHSGALRANRQRISRHIMRISRLTSR